eukprot:1161795-Pelagomonas_calceolata.AAC.14
MSQESTQNHPPRKSLSREVDVNLTEISFALPHPRAKGTQIMRARQMHLKLPKPNKSLERLFRKSCSTWMMECMEACAAKPHATQASASALRNFCECTS